MISFQLIPALFSLYFSFFPLFSFLKFHMVLFLIFPIPAKAASISTLHIYPQFPQFYHPLIFHTIQKHLYLFFPVYFLSFHNVSAFLIMFPAPLNILNIFLFLYYLLHFLFFYQVQNLFLIYFLFFPDTDYIHLPFPLILKLFSQFPVLFQYSL